MKNMNKQTVSAVKTIEINLLSGIVFKKEVQKVGQRSGLFKSNLYKEQYFTFLLNGGLLCYYDIDHNKMPSSIAGFQFIDNFTGFEDSPKGNPNKFSLIQDNMKCVLDLEEEFRKKKWLSTMRTLQNKRLSGQVKHLKAKIENEAGKQFFYTVKNTPVHFMYYLQALSEDVFYSKEKFANNSNNAYLELLNYLKNLSSIPSQDYLSGYYSIDAKSTSSKYPGIFVVNGGDSGLQSGKMYLLKKKNSKISSYLDFNEGVRKIEYGPFITSHFSLVFHFTNKKVTVQTKTVSEIIRIELFLKSQKPELVNNRNSVDLELLIAGIAANPSERETSMRSISSSRSKKEKKNPGKQDYSIEKSRPPTKDQKATEPKIPAKNPVKKEALGMFLLGLSSMNKSTNAADKIENLFVQQTENLEQFKDVYGVDLISERRGDSVCIFSLAEYCIKQFWNLQQTPKNDVKQEIAKWRLGLQWYNDIWKFMEIKRMKDSRELFRQCVSLEFCQFCYQVWNGIVIELDIENITSFKSFIEDSMKIITIFQEIQEPRMTLLNHAVSLTIESKYLNHFKSFIMIVLSDFWQDSNFESDGRQIRIKCFVKMADSLDKFTIILNHLSQEESSKILTRLFKMYKFL